MHGTGRGFHHNGQWHLVTIESVLLYILEMLAHLFVYVVAYHYDFICIVVHENSDESVYKFLSTHLYQWFRTFYSLLGEPAAFACCNNRVFHNR